MYLAGSLDENYTYWRLTAKSALRALRFDVIDSQEHGLSLELPQQSLRELEKSNLVLACCSRPSWSTAMEIFRAHQLGKPVVIFGVGDEINPWLSQHTVCQVVGLTAAIDKLQHIRLILSTLGQSCEACQERGKLVTVELDNGVSMRLCQACFEVLDP